jgi:NADP-dependent 3-hydroxy acid dehydrogenase YdfG
MYCLLSLIMLHPDWVGVSSTKMHPEIAISPDAIAGALVHAINQPENVDEGDIVVRPTILD